MTTTDTAVTEENSIRRVGDERATALGPGLLRLPGGAYQRPSSTTAHARCLGPLAHWKLTSTYFLPPSLTGDEPALFLFPLPPEAALLSLKLADEQLFPGRLGVASRDGLPEDVVVPIPSQGMVDEFGSESLPVLSLNICNCSPNLSGQPTVTIEIEYACGLPTFDGRVYLHCPAYVDQKLVEGQKFQYNLSVVIEDGNELVDEPISHLSLQSGMEGESLVLKGAFSELPELSTVSFRPGRTQMPVTRLRRSDEHFIFSIFPPTSIPASPQRRDIVIAVDASENLEPEVFEKVKGDIIEVLRGLDENDRFALVTFGRDIDGYDGGEFCEIDKVDEACTWLQDSKPQGRADVQPLLVRIQSLPSHDDRQLCIFLLAAGHVGNEPAILRSLDFDQSDRRYYTVGLGPSAKQAFLRRLALLTRGRCEVAEHGNCKEALLRLLGQTRALLAEVTFEELDGKTGVDPEMLVPSKMTSLTPQGPVHCLGLGAPSALRFRSKDETGVFFAGTVNAQPTDNPALAGVWASLRVRELLDSVRLTTGVKRKALMTEAAELASLAGILTEDTVLVLQTAVGVDVQSSALPSCWGGVEAKEKKNSVSSKESTAPFDWRKGLVAREGLFKGSKAGAGGESAESGGRFGLRSKSGQSAETPGKPRLDRSVMSGMPDDVDEVEMEDVSTESQLDLSTENSVVVEESVSQETPEEVVSQALPEAAISDVATSKVEDELAESSSVPVTVSTVSVVAEPRPVLSLNVDSFSEGRVRLADFHRQVESYETRLGLAALAGLPEHLSPSGGELPRILAQTVAHLEKRGYFSQAVSVLGLLLQDHSSPEVERKMESLLIAWSQSLPKDQLPEALQILSLAQRVCGRTAELETERQARWQEWREASGEQGDLSSLLPVTGVEAPDNTGALYSQSQRELAGLRAEQQKLEAKFGEFQSAFTQQLSGLPSVLEQLVEKTLERSLAKVTEKLVSMNPAPSSERKTAFIETAPVAVESEVKVASAEPRREDATPVSEALQEPLPQADTPVVVEEVAEFSIPLPNEPIASEVETESAASPQPLELDIPLPTEAPTPQVQTEVVPPVATRPEVESVFDVSDSLAAEVEQELTLTLEELTEMVTADPRGEDTRKAVEATLREPKERINFFRDLVKVDKDQPHHSLSLARAYRAADQTKVAVVHYQKYLRTEKDAQAYQELADAYDELGKSNLGASARKAAEAFGG